MTKAKKGDWVEIFKIVLSADERAPQVPDDTKKVPLELKLKGFLVNDEAQIGAEVEVETVTGRKVKGELIDILPEYKHNFGRPIQELVEIGQKLKKMLEEVE